MKHIDLFSGIGGFSLAVDRVWHEENNEHIFVEWDDFCTAVLKKHWPEATYYGDIADLVADTDSTGRERFSREDEGRRGQSSRTVQNQEQEMVIVTGGFPCQPFSHAGRRKGTADDRYKWPEMFAVIRNVRPDWVIAENVRGLVTWNEGMVLETVCADLESEGYEVQPFIIPAVAVGAPHRRDRVWIVANRPSTQDYTKHERPCRPGEQQGQTVEAGGKASRQEDGKTSDHRDSRCAWNSDWREVALATCHDRVDDGLPRWMDGVAISAARHRKERLKACGNAIVPAVAEEIMRAIRLVDETRA